MKQYFKVKHTKNCTNIYENPIKF